MPGPIKHAMISKYNAEREDVSGEDFYQRILGALIPDAPIIEKPIHSSNLDLDGHEDYESLLTGIGEHVGMDNIHHGKLRLLFGHEIKEVYDDVYLFLRGKGNGMANLHEAMLLSIEYGEQNIDEIGKVVSEICETDYKQTREGIRKHLKLVKTGLTLLGTLKGL